MFQKLLRWLEGQWDTLFPGAAEGGGAARSGQMENALARWAAMYETGGAWCGGKTGLHSLGLPAAIAAELARLTTLEAEVSVTGSARADWLQAQLAPFLAKLPVYTEWGCALGSVVFKPYVCGGRLAVDVVPGDRFFPTGFDAAGRLTGAVFVEQQEQGGAVYTRLERHEFAAGRETVENLAFVSTNAADLGRQIPLTGTPAWGELAPGAVVEGLEKPLFACFGTPFANRADRSCPLGASVFAAAEDTIRDADEQYGRLLWEYQGGELAVDVDETALRQSADGSVHLAQRDRRLFRNVVAGAGVQKTLFEVFAPTLRDESYRRGLDTILKRVEFQCGLAYGTLSDPQSVEKTAEEVRVSRQRSYATVRALQRALQAALEDLVDAMDAYATLYGLAPAGPYTVACDWDDSVVNDPAQRRQMFWQYVTAGKFPFARYLQEFEGYSADEAEEVVRKAKEK